MEEDNYFINSSGFDMEMQSTHFNSASEQQLQNRFFNPTWESSVDHNDPFESALSSIVSSPVAHNAGTAGEGVMLKELIGRLGSICNSGEISPESYMGGAHHSTNTSCYSTPLNSPPKLNLSVMDQHMRGNLVGTQLPSHPTLAPFSADPGFAERAARYSCFTGSRNFAAMRIDSEKLSRVSSNQSFKVAGSRVPKQHSKASSPENAELGDSREGSSVSEQIPAGIKGQNDGNGRKRKSIAKGKSAGKDTKVASENEESKSKKTKQEANEEDEEATKSSKNGGDGDRKASKDTDSKPPEPPKDYIHVRARRGQATDSHSLAERVRREKISERMKFLQDLVPGCNKVTGKAVMLDEIINYVQSLQRQVEFLSMKLSTVNPRMDINMEALLSKEILQSRGSLPQGMYQLDSSAPAFPYGYHPQQVSYMSDGTGMPLPSMDGFGEGTAPQVSGFWEDDLQSLVQMGFGPNQPQNIHGLMAPGQMKVEL